MTTKIKIGFIAVALSTVLLSSCGGGGKSYEYPFQNPKLSNEERVENLISLLTPEEKVGLMMNKAISVDRLGIPSYNWWSEACHGILRDGYTVYPQNIGMAASFNPTLIYDIFDSISDEARANWNRSEPVFDIPMGVDNVLGNPQLSFWCPNVNIVRDPRWGRGQETLGEDPYLTSILGVQTVMGMQQFDGKYYKTHTCAKHYAVHSGPEPLRHSMDVSVSMRDLWETYLPAFKALVQKADVREVMCAYQRYEGTPCCANDRLLIDILRNKWDYKSIILTDCDAVNNFFTPGQHETHPDAVSASVDAVLSGTDLECGRSFQALVEALKKGLIQESELDKHLRITLNGRFELGMFDPAENVRWSSIGEEVISSEEHDQLSVRIAREAIVLLKNDNNTLPLSKSIKKVAVLGPNANDNEMLNGNYGGRPSEEHKRTLLTGIQNALPNTEVVYEKACEILDEYSTESFIPKFNDGKGVKVEFFHNKKVEGKPYIENYYPRAIQFSTFGAYGFADGVNTEDVAIRMGGTFVPDYTGKLQYHISSDNGYKLFVNGKLVETVTNTGRRMRRGAVPEYKSINVVAGKAIDIKVEYARGNGPFASLSAQFCRREIADFAPIAAKVADADAIIMIGGITTAQEGEGGDRQDIEFPKVQARLLEALHKTGKPVILVNCSGSAMAFTPVLKDCDAIIQAWYPGQGGPIALAEILLGETNPSAKLPVTFYKSTADLPDFLDYNMENRTYRYFRGEPLYPFGYGLSYTNYEYGEAKLSKSSIKAGQSVTITIPVKNTGAMSGDEIVQVYVKSLDNPDAPIKSLKGFSKVNIGAGKSVNVKITLDDEAFAYYDGADGLAVKSGKYQILYGASSADKDLKAVNFEVL